MNFLPFTKELHLFLARIALIIYNRYVPEPASPIVVFVLVEEISRIIELPISAQGSSGSLADSDSSDRASGKRHRTRFTPHQLSAMEAAFSSEKYPDMKARQELSEKLGLSEIQVQVSIIFIL